MEGKGRSCENLYGSVIKWGRWRLGRGEGKRKKTSVHMHVPDGMRHPGRSGQAAAEEGVMRSAKMEISSNGCQPCAKH
jgi:hypothetical protein